MARSAQSARKNKQYETEKSKRNPVSGKVSTTSRTAPLDTSGLRRSARETSSKNKFAASTSTTQNISSSPSSARKTNPSPSGARKMNPSPSCAQNTNPSPSSAQKKNQSSSSAQKKNPSPSSTRRSGRLEKRMVTTPSEKRESEAVESQIFSSPSRRSERAKSGSNSTLSGSKNSERSSVSSIVKQKKEKKKKSVKQLTEETREVENTDGHDTEPVMTSKKRMHAQAFGATFMRKQKKIVVQDQGQKLNVLNESSHGDDVFCKASGSKLIGQGIDCSKVKEDVVRECHAGDNDDSDLLLGKLEREPLRDHSNVEAEDHGNTDLSPVSPRTSCGMHAYEPESGEGIEGPRTICNLPSHGDMSRKMSNNADRVLMDSSAAESLEPPEHMDTMSENSTQNVDASSSGKSGRKRKTSVDSCCACSKRQRLDCNLESQVCFCGTSPRQKSGNNICSEHRGQLEAGSILELVDKSNSTESKELTLDNQINGGGNSCLICKLGGELLFCEGKGCKKCYHPSCLNPPLLDVGLGAWYCIDCVKKKIQFGVHKVSKGIESIWDSKEVEVLDVEGMQKQKQFFVKYKGLAHVHNRWVPESEVVEEALPLVQDIQCNQAKKWMPEWAVPQRLVLKRQLIYTKDHESYHGEGTAEKLDCHYEWLVKWCSLGYEHATWELENSLLLNSPEALGLKTAYENRHRGTENASFSEMRRKGSFVKLPHLPNGVSLGNDINHLESVNKLREFWHKEHNAVILEEPGRLMKVILFILAMESNSCRPFLIIASSSTLPSWESEFLHLAPCTNVVVYDGNKNVRRGIRALEFNDKGERIIFQVLITTSEVIAEDLELLENIAWEAVIVDECQSTTSEHFGKIKMLITDMKILLACGQLKETPSEYHNLLSFLGFRDDMINRDGLKNGSSNNISTLKNMLSKYMVHECKSDSSRFIEYWVPAQISDVQLEQYCSILLSDTISLCSSLKKDPVGALRDILTRCRKCCDHPYIVNPSVQELLIKGLPPAEYLDVGVKASGKLQFLDMILSEMRKKGLRVLILFQSIGGYGKDTICIGDILDDVLRQRFGPDSYERVDVLSKRQAAIDKFNDKASGRFVFLLETKACGSGIKLSSIDAVIIYGSDWNPLNDLKNLQRMTLKSKSEPIKIFRLYTSCTLEEKVLIQAKHGSNIDSVHHTSRTTNHKLLMWGASCLFKKLEEFHKDSDQSPSTVTMSQNSVLTDTLKEFLTILSRTDNSDSTSNSSIISEVSHCGFRYSMDCRLPGELQFELREEEQPHIFWTQLLEGRHPPWKYISTSSQRIRKRAHRFDNLPQEKDVDSNEAATKRKKVVKNSISGGDKEGACGSSTRDSNQLQPGPSAPRNDTLHSDQDFVSPPVHDSNCIPELHAIERTKLQDSQKNLQLVLPDVSKLCKTLQLSEDMKGMVEKLLEHVIKYHHVPNEPTTIIQAFQISLCWTAASLLKQKIDRKQSLALAKQHLNYACSEDEAERVYSKLRCLKSIFLFCIGYQKVADPSTSPARDITVLLESASSDQQKLKQGELSVNPEFSVKQACPQQQLLSVVKIVESDISKSLKKIGKNCHKQMSKLLRNQQEELKELQAICEEEKVELEKNHKLEVAIIHQIHESNVAMRTEKLKNLDDDYRKKYEKHRQLRELRLRDLGEMQLAARKSQQQAAVSWQEEVQSWAHVELLDKLSRGELRSCLEHMLSNNQQVLDDVNGIAAVSSNLSQNGSPDLINLVKDTNACETVTITLANGADTCSDPKDMSGVGFIDKHGNFNTITSTGPATRMVENCKGLRGLAGDSEHVSTHTCSEEQVPNSSEIPMLHGQPQLQASITFRPIDEQGQNSNNTTGTLLKEQFHDNIMVGVPDGEDQSKVSETDRPSGLPENLSSARLSSSGTHLSNNATSSVPNTDIEEEVFASTCLSHGLENVASRVPCSTKRHLVGGFSVGAGGTSSSSDGLVSAVSLSRPSFEINSSSDESALEMPGGQGPSGLPKTINSSENFVVSVTPLLDATSSCPESIMSVDPSSSGALASLSTSRQLPSEVPVVAPDAGNSDNTRASNDRMHGLAAQTASSTEVRPPERDANTVNQDSFFRESSMVRPSAECDLVSSNGALDDGSYPLSLRMGGGYFSSNEMQQLPWQAESSLSSQYDEPCNNPHNETQILARTVATRPSISISSLAGAVIPNHPNQEASMLTSAPLDAVPSVQFSHELFVSEPEHLSSSGRTERLTSSGRTEQQPSNGVCSPQVGQGSIQTSACSHGYLMQTLTQEASRPPIPLFADPLKNEIERIRKETDQTGRLHEEMKLQVKSDCDKEIEEVVAQIRQKYENKLQVVEAEFVAKKTELDTNLNRVLMNKILADAFRSKCMDAKAFGASMVQEDMTSSFRQQLALLSLPQAPPQPSLVPCPSSADSPASTLQSSTPLGLQLSLPLVSTSMIQATQGIHHSSGVAMSVLPRPNQLNALPPINLPVGGEIRAPAPHLHPLRPAISMSAASFAYSSAVPSQLAPNNSAVPSLLTQLSSQVQLPTHQSVPSIRRHLLETAGFLPSLSSSSLATLLRQMNAERENHSNNLLPSVTVDSSLGLAVRPDFGTQNAVHVTSSHTGERDVVCLSDDD